MATFVMLEIVLRVFGVTDPVLYERDPCLGYRLKPAQQVSYIGNDIIINDWGLRDPRAFEGPPPAGTQRILVLGDSVTWGGIRLPQEALFTTRLEHNLGVLGHDAEVLNAGVNGYSVAQMATLYETHLADLSPDLVLVYAIPRDFLRPPTVKLARNSVAFPLQRPSLALPVALDLARINLHKRLDWDWLDMGPIANAAPSQYDETTALGENIAAYQRLAKVTGGRSMLLLAPTRSGKGDTTVEEALQEAGIPYHRIGDQMTMHLWEQRFADDVHLTARGHEAVSEAIVETLVTASTPPKVDVTHEENVYTHTPANNGSGPFWSFGCTTIARLGDAVFVSEMETGEDVPPLCNTRWRLHKRTQEGWSLFADADGYRQREPAVLATAGPETLYLNVNDSMEPPGTKYGPCTPYLLKFSPGNAANPAELTPDWEGKPHFTDHSYRGFAADREADELLMLNEHSNRSRQDPGLPASPQSLRR
ncbi:MAG: SGNH/GDSL hydrolase family protein [Candidatus Hydrogenedentota bacterium]